MGLENRIKVCIRGMSGLLGMRLALAIQKQPDIVLVAGIVRNDETLGRVLNSPFNEGVWPSMMYLDEPQRAVRELNDSQSKIRFMPADQLNLAKVCDVVIDATAPGSRQKWEERYRHFQKPVIIQSGEYPAGRLISPPFIEDGLSMKNVYRQGDCILSALTPVISALEQLIETIRISVLMQYGQRLHDYPTSQRINSTYLRDDLASQIKDELERLFECKKIIMEGVLQVPGLDYYTATIHLDSKIPLEGKDIEGLLRKHPRVFVAPKGISSTYEIDHLLREESRSLGKDIPPIVVYSGDFEFTEARRENIRIRMTIYSRLIAVLPNIDSIRILAGNVSPLEAMRMTDNYAGFS